MPPGVKKKKNVDTCLCEATMIWSYSVNSKCYTELETYVWGVHLPRYLSTFYVHKDVYYTDKLMIILMLQVVEQVLFCTILALY